MTATAIPYYLAGRPEAPNRDLAVEDKYDGGLIAEVALADDAAIDRAVTAAVKASEPMRRLPAHRRSEILRHCVRRFEERSDELAEGLCREAGKPIRDARGEVGRLIDTFRIASEEAVRIYGEVLPMDISARGEGYSGLWKRIPVGPCSFISPFNFPLNLVAHKVAPAIAAGCPFVLKPASLTPLGALVIAEVLAETELPPGAFSVLPCRRDQADRFTTDPRIRLLSFTGSPQAGWGLKSKAGKKQVILELGGNAACVVDADADLDDAVTRNVFGGYYQSGQSCISVQRILVHRDVYDEFRDRFVAAVQELRAGDPRDESTFIGPLISGSQCQRVADWVEDAVASGARLLCGGIELGNNVYAPTVLEDVPRDARVEREEIFGPVTNLSRFDRFEDALERVNDSRYGIHAGVFTGRIEHAHLAWDRLDVAGVCINEVPSYRIDHAPYGGIKDSGLGREGVRWAIDHLTEPKMLIMRHPTSSDS